MKLSKFILIAMIITLLSAPIMAFDMDDFDFFGQYRFRAQMMNNGDMDDNTGDHYDFMRQRIQLGFDGDINSKIYIKIVTEFEDTMGSGAEEFVADNNNGGWRAGTKETLKLQQGYLKISDVLMDNVTVTVGRQLYFLGQGFVLTDDWDGLDGIKVNYKSGKFDMDIVNFKINDDWAKRESMTEKDMYGAIANYNFDNMKLTGYYIVDKDSNDSDGIEDEKNFIGIRGTGNISQLSYIAQYIMQGGEDVSDNDYDASSMYAALSYDVEDFYGLTINVDYYKGTGNDTSSGNTDNEAFGSEVTYGYFVDSFWYDYYLDAAANAGVFLTNLEAIGLGINFDPADKWHVITHYYMLSKEESNGSNDDLGDELGIKVSYKIDDVSNAYVTYSQFMPDDNYGEDDSTYLACQYAVNF